MEEEIWSPIEGFEDKYEVSNFGNVKSLEREVIFRNTKKITKERLLGKYTNGAGYISVKLYIQNKISKNLVVHRLVAKAFIPNPENYPQINHIDGDKTNNNYWNLEWCNNSQNTQHAYDNKLKDPKNYKGSGNWHSKITEEAVIELRKDYRSNTFSREQLSRKYNLTKNHIGLIVNNFSWKHV